MKTVSLLESWSDLVAARRGAAERPTATTLQHLRRTRDLSFSRLVPLGQPICRLDARARRNIQANVAHHVIGCPEIAGGAGALEEAGSD